jgi:hypothetical protein
MPRQRSPEIEYSRETIEGRIPVAEPLVFDGEAEGSVSAANPLPVSDSSEGNIGRTLSEIGLLRQILREAKLTNLYLAEMLGDKFDDY